MLQIAICDDEPAMTGYIEELLLALADEMKVRIEVSIFFDGTTLEQNIRQGNEYHLLYLDIEMRRKSGIDVAKSLRESNHHTLIIYVSSHESYAKDLFELEVFRFLCKPVRQDKFREYFIQAVNKLNDESEYFEFMSRRERYKVYIRNIYYFESCKRVINVHTLDRLYSFYSRLNDVEQHINAERTSFIRVHQSYLVNYSYIKVIGIDYVELVNGVRIQMSEDRQKKIRQDYCKLLSKEISGGGDKR